MTTIEHIKPKKLQIIELKIEKPNNDNYRLLIKQISSAVSEGSKA
jgi:hypothetical protein